MFMVIGKVLGKVNAGRQRIEKFAKAYSGVLFAGLLLLIVLSVLRTSLFGEVSEEKRIWFELSFLLLAAILAELLVVYLKQPTVMTLLIVGVAISPSMINLAYPFVASLFASAGLTVAKSIHFVTIQGTINVFAQLGAILLLFKIGLHSEVTRVFNAKNLVVALVGVVVPFLCGYYYAEFMGHSFVYSMFLGAALTATSVGITVAVLEEFKVLGKEFAQVILGAAVIDDILALLVLSLVSGAQTGFEIGPLAYLIASALIFVIGGIYLGQYIVKRHFDSMLAGTIENKTFLLILAYVLAYAYVAEYIGLSAIVGAFIAGITLNFSKNTGKLFSLFYPLEAFFTPIFFISLGMLVDVNALAANLLPIAVVTLIAIAAKIIGCGLSALATGSSAKDSLIIGIGMAPRGEIALIIGLFGLTAGVLSASEYAVIASMAFITTVITPAILGRLLAQGSSGKPSAGN